MENAIRAGAGSMCRPLFFIISLLCTSIGFPHDTSVSFNADIRIEAVNINVEGGVFFQDAPIQNLSAVGVLTSDAISCYCESDTGFKFLVRYNLHTNRSEFWSHGMVRQFGPHAGHSTLGVSTVLQALLPFMAVGRIDSAQDVLKKENLDTSITRMYSTPISYEGSLGKTALLHELTQFESGSYSITAYARYDAGGTQESNLLPNDEFRIYKIDASAVSLPNQNHPIFEKWESTHYAFDSKNEQQAPFLQITGTLTSFNAPTQKSYHQYLNAIELTLWPYKPDKTGILLPNYSWKRHFLPDESPLD